MMKIFIIFTIFFIGTLNAEEIKGEISPFDSSTPAKIGSFVEAKLLLGPNGEKYRNELEKNVGKNLFKGFFLQEVRDIQVLEGGEGYLEADITLIPIAPIDPGAKYEWKIGETKISFSLKGFKGEAPDINPSKIIILEQPTDRNWFYIKLGVLLLSILLLFTGYLLWKRAKNKSLVREREKKRQENINFWKAKIKNAKERADFEKIYEERDIWSSLITISSKDTEKFFNIVEKHQYRPSWSELELDEVQKAIMDFKRNL